MMTSTQGSKPLWESVDLEAYLRDRVLVHNENGGRGHAQGIRVFHCPLCKETKHRGWVSVARWGAGCWNLGCVAEPSLEGGAVEWARRVEGFASRGRTWAFLLQKYPLKYGSSALYSPPPVVEDWCTLPQSIRYFSSFAGGIWKEQFEQFIQQQWGIDQEDAEHWQLGYCLSGRYEFRVIIPILEHGHPIAFQGRTIRPGVQPKYITSSHGPKGTPKAECGRPAGSILFNISAVRPEEDVVLVEGAGDVMGFHSRHFSVPAVGLLGMLLTPEKIAMLRSQSPRQIIVAMDAEKTAQRRGLAHLDDLEAWGLRASLGIWSGGKDAGEGAVLDVSPPLSLRDQIVRRLEA